MCIKLLCELVLEQRPQIKVLYSAELLPEASVHNPGLKAVVGTGALYSHQKLNM